MSSGGSSNLCYHPRKQEQGNQPTTIATFSMVFSGCTARVLHGGISQNAIVFHRTISSRFYRWRKAGIWQNIWQSLMQQADVAGEVDWEVHFVDGTIVRAHQHVAGALVGDPEAEANGRSQG